MKKIALNTLVASLTYIAVVALLSPYSTKAEEPAKEASPKPPAAKEEKTECLFYEPGVVTLKGTLQRLGSVWVLELNDSICIDKRGEDPMNLYPAAWDVAKVLFWKRRSDSPDQYKNFLDEEVVVTGTLHHKNIEPNKGSIMMVVSDIDVTKENSNDDDDDDVDFDVTGGERE